MVDPGRYGRMESWESGRILEYWFPITDCSVPLELWGGTVVVVLDRTIPPLRLIDKTEMGWGSSEWGVG